MGYVFVNDEKEKHKNGNRKGRKWKEIGKEIINKTLKTGEVIAKGSMKLGEGVYNYMEDRFGDEDDYYEPKTRRKPTKGVKKGYRKPKKKKVTIEYGQ